MQKELISTTGSDARGFRPHPEPRLQTKTIVLCERGILGWETLLGDWKQWPNEAVAWVHNHTEARAQTLPYFVTALFAALTRTKRARQFGEMLQQYSAKGWRVIILAHSEGTATVLRALQMHGWPRIVQLHLVCGACDADFNRNGLNRALTEGRIGSVHVYVAGKDLAMWIEDTVLGRWCFGIRTRRCELGLSGPVHPAPEHERDGRIRVVKDGRWQRYGHSTCWAPAHFEKTMEELLGVQTSAPPAAPNFVAGLESLTKHKSVVVPPFDRRPPL